MASLSLSPQQAPPPWPSTSPSKTYYNYTFDCSVGICSLNCPQWCFLPPPPPLFLNADGDPSSSSSSRVSPLMAALIAVLAAAFLLLFYFTVISRFCRNRNRRNHNRGNSSSNSPFIDDTSSLSTRVDSLIRDPARPDAGLDDAFIRQITVFKYRREDKLVEGTECAVCLTEFNEGESLRLMPNCEHAFHIPCIDTWLKTHSNCPLCRSTMNPVPPRVHHVPNSGSGSGLISDQTGRTNSNSNNNSTVGVAALRVERSSNDVVLMIREMDNSVHVVDEVINQNLDDRDTKLNVNIDGNNR